MQNTYTTIKHVANFCINKYYDFNIAEEISVVKTKNHAIKKLILLVFIRNYTI